MPARKKLPLINLVPKDPFYETIIGKTMLWSLKIGRYLIVFTEIIVIMSFASRFKLDKDLTDLNTKILQKTAVVDSYGDIEKRVRLIQKKSELVAGILKENTALSDIDIASSKVPNDVKLTRLGVRADIVELTGLARSATGFAQLLSNLQHEPAFKAVTVDQITSGDKRDPGFNFTIHVSLKDTPIQSTTTAPAKESTKDTEVPL